MILLGVSSLENELLEPWHAQEQWAGSSPALRTGGAWAQCRAGSGLPRLALPLLPFNRGPEKALQTLLHRV